MRSVAMTGVLLLFSACTVPVGTLPQPRPVPAEPVPDATLVAVARNVIAEANRTRQAHGLGALQEDAALMRAARGHSAELAERRMLDHSSTDPELRTMTMRIEAAGGTWMRAAENLANLGGSASRVPPHTIRMWLESDGHRRNLLEPAYTHTGVGVSVDSRGYWYVTQLYVIPRPAR